MKRAIHITVILTVLVLSAVSPALAQDRDEVPRVPAAMLQAQGFLFATYPELREARMVWRLDTTKDGVIIEARHATAPFEDVTTTTASLVDATMRVDDQGQLVELKAGGTLLAAARVKVAPARGRNARDVERMLREANAKYLPDADTETLEALVPAGLKATLGASAVREATFRTDTDESAGDEWLTWRVDVDSADTLPRRYTLVFEPIEGRLISVVRR